MSKAKVHPAGATGSSLANTPFTPAEIAAGHLRVALVGEIINTRRRCGLSQKRLGEMGGVRQPVIARLEKGVTDPQLSTVLKVLAPLGKTLAIVPLEKP
ncbi:MAG: helix-turn-helix domain-containing protein [Syntrophomonadaceae bacterium]|nr:helix-turn-helix domain-containing protein [Syntrophomonadaceae bacterium]